MKVKLIHTIVINIGLSLGIDNYHKIKELDVFYYILLPALIGYGVFEFSAGNEEATVVAVLLAILFARFITAAVRFVIMSAISLYLIALAVAWLWERYPLATQAGVSIVLAMIIVGLGKVILHKILHIRHKSKKLNFETMDELPQEMIVRYTQQDEYLFEEALCFLAKHYKTREKNVKPFMIHSVRVAHILQEHHAPVDVVVAAYLHDLLEDTNCTLKEINEAFGDHVALLVSLSTYDKTILDYNARYREHFKRISGNSDALLLKAADIIDNRQYLNLATPKMAKQVQEKHKKFVDMASNTIEFHALFKRLHTEVGLH